MCLHSCGKLLDLESKEQVSWEECNASAAVGRHMLEFLVRTIVAHGKQDCNLCADFVVATAVFHQVITAWLSDPLTFCDMHEGVRCHVPWTWDAFVCHLPFLAHRV